MNIDQAKAIAIVELLSRLGIHPKRTTPEKSLYLSPIRKENTPSFWVYTKPNRWHDYGIGQGGDTIDLARAYLDMGDRDTARSLLQEVAARGDTLSVRQEATRLLHELG